MRDISRIRVALTIAASLGVLVASSQGASATVRGSAASASCVKQATADLERNSKQIAPPKKLAPIPMRKLRGKTVWWIQPNVNATTTAWAQSLEAAGKAAGIKIKVFDGEGLASAWNEGVSEAVAQHANGLILQGMTPALVSGPLADALKAHIPVIDANTGDLGQPLNGLYSHLDYPRALMGSLQADYVLAMSKCSAHVLYMSTPSYASIREQTGGFIVQMRKLCPLACRITSQNLDPTTLATTAGPIVQNAVNKDPSINWVVSATDDAAALAVTALQQVGSKAQVVGATAATPNLQYLKQGSQAADIAGAPNSYLGWIELNTIARAMLHLPASGHGNVRLPAMILTKGNFPSPTNPFPKFSNVAKTFTKAWKG